MKVILLHAVVLSLAVANEIPQYMVVPGAGGFQVDSFQGSPDLYTNFVPPLYKENRGHVGTWLTEAPLAFESQGSRKVLPRFYFNATLVEEQNEFPLPNYSLPLQITADYAMYNSFTDRVRRMESVFDAILNTNQSMMIIGTSEGGAIIQKLLESDELAAHMKRFEMRISIISPAYAVGDASIVDDPFYKRAGLDPNHWWVSDQAKIYDRGIPIHVFNTDMGFAGMQGMRDNSSGVDLTNYESLLAGGAYDQIDLPTITWDFLPGAPHSLPTCNVLRRADADAGLYNGIDVQGHYSGSHNDKVTDDLSTLFSEFVRSESWAASDREFYSKHSSTKSPTIYELFDRAKREELERAGGSSDDDIIAYRYKTWRGEMEKTDECNERIEAERAQARVQQQRPVVINE